MNHWSHMLVFSSHKWVRLVSHRVDKVDLEGGSKHGGRRRGEHVYGYEPEKGKGLWTLRGHTWQMCQMKSGQPHVKPRLMRPKHYFFLETASGGSRRLGGRVPCKAAFTKRWEAWMMCSFNLTGATESSTASKMSKRCRQGVQPEMPVDSMASFTWTTTNLQFSSCGLCCALCLFLLLMFIILVI